MTDFNEEFSLLEKRLTKALAKDIKIIREVREVLLHNPQPFPFPLPFGNPPAREHYSTREVWRSKGLRKTIRH